MSGMIFGNGFSGEAKRSLVEYLEGYMKGRGVFYVEGVGGGCVGPGVALRNWFRKNMGGLAFPFLFWLLFEFTLYARYVRGECSSFHGLDDVCGTVWYGGGYPFHLAVRHFCWLWFYFLYEGDGALFEVSAVSVGALGVAGLFVGKVVPFFGRELVVAAVLLACWSFVGTRLWLVRWVTFFLCMTGYGAAVVVVELLLFGGGESVTCVLVEDDLVGSEYVPHKYLSIEVPQGSCGMTRGYFVDRPQGSGMSNVERVMALKGDRFLKLLAVEIISERAEAVAFVTEHEKAHEDKVFLRWVESVGIVSENGKKTKASYVEVMWGEIFELLRDGKVTYTKVWEAFVVFQRQVVSLVIDKEI